MLEVDVVLRNPKWQLPFWLKAKTLKTSRAVWRLVVRHNKQGSTCKTNQINWFIISWFTALLLGLVGGAWPPKCLSWSLRREFGELLLLSWDKRSLFIGLISVLICWERTGLEEGGSLTPSRPEAKYSVSTASWEYYSYARTRDGWSYTRKETRAQEPI